MSIRVIANEDVLGAHSDLQAHCERQRKRIAELEKACRIVKSERDAYKRQAETYVARIDKLRKLARDAHACMTNGGDCESCFEIHEECPIELEMRGLGIEVPE